MMHVVLYLIQIMFKFKGQVVRNSAACIAIDVNVIKGDCIVKYHNDFWWINKCLRCE